MNKPEGAGTAVAAAEKRMDDARDLLQAANNVNDPVMSAYALNMLIPRVEDLLKRLCELREAEGQG